MSLAYQPEAVPDQEERLPQIVYPIPYYTWILVGSIIAVAMAQFGTGLEASVSAAGFDKPAFRSGEYWRMLTGATTHGGGAHLLMNCFAFYNFGKIFEILANRAHLAIVFLLSAVGGSILSLIFVPDGLSVGASGGIVGLIGYMAVYAFKRRRFVTAEFRKSLLINIGIILIFGLLLFQVIDNFGHIGGLLTGAVYALIQVPADELVDPRQASGIVRLVGLAALAIYVGACLFSILVITGVA